MDAGPPINLQYQTPGPRPRGTGPAYLVSRLISSYIGYILVMGVLVLAVPRFEQVFRDFKLNLPAITVALLLASRVCRQYYLWVILAPVPGLWAVANFNIANVSRRRRIRVSAFLFVAAFLIFTLIALFLPMTGLVQGITPTTQP